MQDIKVILALFKRLPQTDGARSYFSPLEVFEGLHDKLDGCLARRNQEDLAEGLCYVRRYACLFQPLRDVRLNSAVIVDELNEEWEPQLVKEWRHDCVESRFLCDISDLNNDRLRR